MMHGSVENGKSGGKHLRVEFRPVEPGERWLICQEASDERYDLALIGDLLPREGGFRASGASPAKSVLDGYRRDGLAFFAGLNGSFAVAILDRISGELLLVRDHLGVEPLYYRLGEDGRIEFGTSLRALAAGTSLPEGLNFKGLTTYLLLNYNPSEETLIDGIRKVPPGYALHIRGQEARKECYWRPDFGEKLTAGLEELVEALREQMDRAVRLRVAEDRALGVSVSGGMDSSTVTAFVRRYYRDALRAFSFRCAVESYDESHYAALVARHYGAVYEQVEYTPERALEAAEMVSHMDEPQADLGIEVATYLLGRHAEGKVDLLLTGDGGDELFAGHPVYLADRAARAWERVPAPFRRPVVWFASLLPESHKKASFRVKLKRFVQGQQFPRQFHSNRWRLYYTSDSLRQFLTPQAWERTGESHRLEWLRDLYRSLPWPEELDRALFGDYFTVVQFYLRRLSLLRAFGIQARCPLLDPELVQFCARIPAEFKIPSSREQKFIQKKAMEGILPDAIVHRKDKLGHSVPMRKWLREANPLSEAVRSMLLADPRLVTWGLVRPAALEEMFEEYRKGTRDHSHRIWALYVLELWLRSWE
jgi:asparagine synthase (glutamine-hydrolysing)